MMRIKVVEILKFIVAVAIGFTFRVMFENSFIIPPNSSKQCFSNKYPSDLSFENIHEQLRQPHQPSSIRDIIEYRYFNSSVVFDTHLGNIKTQMKQYHRSDIRDVIKQVESLINAGVNNRYKMKRIVNGFERIDPVRGKEYVIDVELTPESPTVIKPKPRIIRYSLVKPFSYIQMVLQSNVSPTVAMTINMLYAVNGNDQNSIRAILAHHDTYIVNAFPVNVTILLCTESVVSADVRQLVNSFALKHQSVSSYKISLSVTEACTFHAAELVNTVVQSIDNTNSRLVILDPNVNVSHQFLQRCSSVLSESQNNVYVPIPFARFLHPSLSSDDDELSEGSGVWDHDNFEVLCIHKRTFQDANGLNKNEFRSQAYKTMLNSLIKIQKQIFRSTDPSVTVFYHNLKCNDQVLLRYSNQSQCEDRQRRTYRAQTDFWKNIKLD